MDVSGPGAGIPRQGFPTEARIESPQPQDAVRDRAAPVDQVEIGQPARAESSATPPQSITPVGDHPERVDITV